MTGGESTPQVLDNHLTSTIITNRTIANYKLVELRGSGGMANIFKAIQLSLDRPVALKIMHPHLCNNEAFINRFEKEAKRAAVMQHDNIVSIIDYGCDNSEYYIAMEYIDGTNLGDILLKQKRMPLEICLFICHQVAEGLKYAHSQNIIHRDIKPGNIMLSYDGRVMITDFGIAKAEGDLSITSTGQVIGSPSYMSPEQAAGKGIDHRSDLFSLGIIFYEILAGEKPFKGETYQSLVASIMSDYPVSLREKRMDVTSEIDDLALKALAKSVDSRYQSADEFSEALSTQLTKFKIPSARKMMAEYLKNPVRVAERLRTDKITDHMESALYFLAVGEGKLAEAKREFHEVLRFDRGNKEAKKYLARLDSHPSLRGNDTRENKAQTGFNTRLAFVSAGVILLLCLAFLLLPGDEKSKIKSDHISADGGALSNPTLIIGRDGQRNFSWNSPADSIAGSLAIRTDRQTAKTGQVYEKDLAYTGVSNYNYPNQGLARFGTVSVMSNVAGRISIDSQEYGATNGPPIKLSPGRHLVEVRADGFKKASKRIFIKRGDAENLRFKLTP